MSRNVKAWVCEKGGEKLHEREIELPALGPNDIEVKIKACGVCSSDMMILRAPMDIPPYKFPLVAGHEGVGYVTAVGSEVRHLVVGDAVGVGLQRSSCDHCRYCSRGLDISCLDRTLLFADGHAGCFAEVVRTKAKYGYKLPAGLEIESAAPLMCAGITTFSPFVNLDIRPGSRVGVVGIGGLGHLSIQFARAWGCEVYAFSTSPSKEEEAKQLGAHHFITDYSLAKDKIDYLMITAAGSNLNWDAMVGTIAKRGHLIIMGISHTPISFQPMTLIGKSLSIHGSAAGSSADCKEMLDFVALHNIKIHCEKLPFDQVNEAIDKVASSKMFGRVVLVRDN